MADTARFSVVRPTEPLGRTVLDSLLDRVTPASLDPRAVLRDHLRLAEEVEKYLEPYFRRYGFELIADVARDRYAPIERPHTLAHGDALDVALLQVPEWVVGNGNNVGTMDEIRTAFEHRVVRVVSPKCDAPSLALRKMFDDWQNRYRIDARFVPWSHILELEKGFSVIEVFELPLEPAASEPLDTDRVAIEPEPGAGRTDDEPTPRPTLVREAVTQRSHVFISYSHADRDWFDRLQLQLKPLMRGREALIWDDRRIRPGERWREEIGEALASARVAVLLVSRHFLASDFIASDELPPILAKAGDDLEILWVLLDACNWDRSPIAAYQAAHEPLERLDGLEPDDQEQVLQQVSRLIAERLGDG